ncbi:MAG: hypothetical protein EXR55_06060 [Dehalococcoidia bacterium]|nr:hypothetical protein [Dehalococcoidia bacterium]
MQCARHPRNETFATCVRCGTPICYRCQVRSDVGLFCPTHGRSVALPQYDVTPFLYLQALGASLLVGALGGVALWFLARVAPILIFSLLGMIALGFALGYAVGEGVGWAARGKRGRGLQGVAALGVALAMLVGMGGLALTPVNGVVGLLVGVVVAAGRLR